MTNTEENNKYEERIINKPINLSKNIFCDYDHKQINLDRTTIYNNQQYNDILWSLYEGDDSKFTNYMLANIKQPFFNWKCLERPKSNLKFCWVLVIKTCPSKWLK